MLHEPPSRFASKDTSSIDAIWSRIIETSERYTALDRECWVLEDGLPWWAVKGLRIIGCHFHQDHGGITEIPAIVDLERPTDTRTFRYPRPGPVDFDRWRQGEQSALRALPAKIVEDRYAQRKAAFKDRCRLRDSEDEKAGITRLDSQKGSLLEVIDGLRGELEREPGTLEKVAAWTLTELLLEGTRSQRLSDGSDSAGVVALTGLLPMIRGAVAATVADFLTHADRPLVHHPLWLGWWPADVDPNLVGRYRPHGGGDWLWFRD